ncbi:hypothetical protein [Micromonospora carbonacea]|uniref:Uncharacterized protein n=1 Tax=Micromonospora carbonacea TaxID=47853 RepID=A0A1C4X685_9ACTN|nr:hypothetical protein [Micromonospora carbonacea]SCF03959.1 hypothetical protein GA0070563_104263 [Micromonospora carbonacea]
MGHDCLTRTEPGNRTGAPDPTDPVAYRARLAHAGATYGHGRYADLLRLAPALLVDGHRLPAGQGEQLVWAYRLVAFVLVKFDAAELAWLAADRALAAAGDDPVLAAVAVVPLGQALRANGRPQAAFELAVVAAHQVAPLEPGAGTAAERAACAAALLQAALAAVGAGDRSTVDEMLDDAAAVTEPDGPERAAVDAARVAAAVLLGDGRRAVDLHEAFVGGPAWGRLPIEHRAAHLVDVAGAYVRAGDAAGAGAGRGAAARGPPGARRGADQARRADRAGRRAGRGAPAGSAPARAGGGDRGGAVTEHADVRTGRSHRMSVVALA